MLLLSLRQVMESFRSKETVAAKKPVIPSYPGENAVKVPVITFKKLKTEQKKAASEKPLATPKVFSAIPKARFMIPEHIEDEQEKQCYQTSVPNYRDTW